MIKRIDDESGASLLLVVVFISVFSVIVAAILDFGATGFKTSETIASVRKQQTAADGAVDAAINLIRGSSTAGLAGNACPPLSYDDPDSGAHIDVTCTAVGGS